MPVLRPFAALALAALAAGGCASGSGAKAPEPAAPVVRREDFLALLDGAVPDELKKTLEVRNYSFAAGDEPRVALDIFNASQDRTLSFEIRTLFFREDSSLVDATEWTAASAPPRGTFRYRAQSFSPWAKKEQVQLRMVRTGAAR